MEIFDEHQKRWTKWQLLSEADFQERLVEFFRPFVSVWPVDWVCIRESVIHFAPCFEFDELSNLYFDYVFGLFEDFRITDRAAIDLCLTGYCKFEMFISYKRRFPMKSPPDFGDYFSLEPLVEEPPSLMLMFDIRSLRRILRYAAPLITEWKDLRAYARIVSTYMRNNCFVLDHADSFQLESVGVHGRRLQLIVMAAYLVLMVREFNHPVCPFQGFRLLFQAIPDPRVTWQEIFGFLMASYWNSESINHSFIESFRESCERYLPKCARVPEPRSLKHLSRCEVRRCLSATHNLPHGVWGLGLPRELEDYVLLQRQMDRPVTIPPLSTERIFAVPEIQSQETMRLVRRFSPRRPKASEFSSSTIYIKLLNP